MKRERLTPRDIAVLGSVIFLALCCICVGTVLTTFEDFGTLVTAPLRWLGDIFGNNAPTLRQALDSSSPASFELGENCTFPFTDGTLVQSQGANEDSGAHSTRLSHQQVVDRFQAFTANERFLVQDGKVHLRSGTPVEVSQITRESFYLSLIDEQVTSTERVTINLEGVVDENLLSGSYYATHTQSAVDQGQGIEMALTVMADFSCPLYWEDD
jgi:hypothetical protein